MKDFKSILHAIEVLRDLRGCEHNSDRFVACCYGIEALRSQLDSNHMIETGDKIYIPASGLYGVVTKPSVNGSYSKIHIVFSDGSTDIIDRDTVYFTGTHYPEIHDVLESLKLRESIK